MNNFYKSNQSLDDGVSSLAHAIAQIFQDSASNEEGGLFYYGDSYPTTQYAVEANCLEYGKYSDHKQLQSYLEKRHTYLDKLYIMVCWHVGGYSGGSCYTDDPAEPFDVDYTSFTLDNAITKLTSTFPLDKINIDRITNFSSFDCDGDYYGNFNTYHYSAIKLTELYEALFVDNPHLFDGLVYG